MADVMQPLELERPLSRWGKFWHQPLRAESLALVRILFGLALLGDLLFQYLPNLAYFYGPEGVAPAGINDAYLGRAWRWPVLFFSTDDMTVIRLMFAAWMLSAVGLMVGWQTRFMTVAAWFMTFCFLTRNPNIKNGGDDTMQVALFLMMFMPVGAVYSVDSWRKRRKLAAQGKPAPSRWIEPWSLRLFQLQLCVIYTATGIAKLRGETWYEGTSIHNVMNDITLNRWSFAAFPTPLWISAPLTWATLIFEVGFIPLVLWKRTRFWTLMAGIAFHIGILATVEVGWFTFYICAMYPAFIAPSFWDRSVELKPVSAKTGAVVSHA